jgi:hypothetical protein
MTNQGHMTHSRQRCIALSNASLEELQSVSKSRRLWVSKQRLPMIHHILNSERQDRQRRGQTTMEMEDETRRVDTFCFGVCLGELRS